MVNYVVPFLALPIRLIFLKDLRRRYKALDGASEEPTGHEVKEIDTESLVIAKTMD